MWLVRACFLKHRQQLLWDFLSSFFFKIQSEFFKKETLKIISSTATIVTQRVGLQRMSSVCVPNILQWVSIALFRLFPVLEKNNQLEINSIPFLSTKGKTLRRKILLSRWLVNFFWILAKGFFVIRNAIILISTANNTSSCIFSSQVQKSQLRKKRSQSNGCRMGWKIWKSIQASRVHLDSFG